MSWLTAAFATVNDVAPQNAPRSAPRVIAAIVLAFEASALAVATLAYVTLAIVDDGDSREFLVGIAILSALSAVGLGLASRGLARGRRWAVGPSLTWQVLQGFVGAWALSNGSPGLGLGLLVPAVIGGIALVLTARGSAASSS